MSATLATERHQETASGLVAYGAALTSRTGCAPRSLRSRRNSSTFARYWAVVSFQGVGAVAPKSSFSTIRGVEHVVRPWASRNSFSAASPIVEGSAGAFGVPTLFLSFRSNE